LNARKHHEVVHSATGSAARQAGGNTPPIKLRTAVPFTALRDYVRSFEQREADIEADVVFPIAARPYQFLEFYLQGRYLVESCDSRARDVVPCAVVVGPSTCRSVDLVLHGHLDVFTIQFQPSGFHQLFGVPMPELTDRALEARSVLGPSFCALERRLADAPSFSERVRLATNFLLDQGMGLRKPDIIGRLANDILESRGALRLGAAAERGGLSLRQLERRFRETVGVAPKRYARIVRFHAASEAKAHSNERAWTDIAHDLGYYDQMHMVHDFRIFAGESPTGWNKRLAAIGQSWL
jgi:AraC-like DNA-binding protein